jgi:pyrimidine-nucleoside phosphorylase
MSQPLAPAVGNALELKAAFAELHLGMRGRLGQVVMALAEGACEEAGAKISPREAVDSGAAAGKLREWITAQGGDEGVVDDPSLLPSAPITAMVLAGDSGYVAAFDCRCIGETARALGAGRLRIDDDIEPSVGIEVSLELGDRVDASTVIYTIHAKTQEAALHAAESLRKSFTISPAAPRLPALVSIVK